MQILAHRGLWTKLLERNTTTALKKAFAGAFGIETDVRDYEGRLVIAHDIPVRESVLLESVLELHSRFAPGACLALNIKSDGLRDLLALVLKQFEVNHYFCFDMSTPEVISYRMKGLRFFTRESEYETLPVLYDDAAGIWMDMFNSDWIKPVHITRHLEAGKQVALVSPELHQRSHIDFWLRVRDAGLSNHPKLMLCTDYPEAAMSFFHD